MGARLRGAWSAAQRRQQMRHSTDRLLAIDVFRGIVMLLLLPDPQGGFSFYAMAREFPDSALWTSLAGQLTHVQWSGIHIWDLIMPGFIFVAGAAMALSVAARRRDGESEARIFGHVLLRAATLLVLAWILRIDFHTHLDELWPMLMLSVGLPIGRWSGRILGFDTKLQYRIQLAWWLAVLAASLVRLCAYIYDIGLYRFENIFSQLALASLGAYFFIGRPARRQLGGALLILIAFWCLFAFWPVIPYPADPMQVGVRPGDEVFTGWFAHWNKNANVAWLFDRWFLNLMPRDKPFEFDPAGLDTLTFIPTIVTMVFGIMAGELLQSGRPRAAIRNLLVLAGVGAVIAGVAAGVWLCPIVKSLWTPSYALVSGGICVLTL